jgi:hypothetical protein
MERIWKSWPEPKGKWLVLFSFFGLQKKSLKSIFIQKSCMVCLLLWTTKASLAQEILLNPDFESEENNIPRHKISLILGHTHVPSGFSNGKKTMLVVPSWGLDYNYLLNRKWALGIHSDFYTENFSVIDFGGKEEFLRERPITLTIVGSYSPHEKWSLIAGTGYEFAKEENLSIIRLGVERAWELPKKWEFVATIQYDLRVGVFNSWMVGLGVSKSI